jgi:DNA-binding beta-propeller fold protein YncE
MSWQSNRGKVGPLLRAALLAAALAPGLSTQTHAAPADPKPSIAPNLLFAVDPVLGQAYVGSPGSEDPPSASGGSISVLNLASRREIGSIPQTVPPSAIDVNPLTGLVYIASKTQDTITVIHGPTLRLVSTTRVTGGPQALLVEPSSGKLYVGLGRERSIRVLDMTTLTPTGAADVGMEPLALGLDRVRNRLMATVIGTEADSAALVVLDNEGLAPVTHISLPDRPTGLAVLDGLGRVYVPLESAGDLLLIDAEKLQVSNRLSGWDTPIRDVAVNERRSRVYLSAGDRDLLMVLDPLTGSILGSTQAGGPIDALAVDPATATIYAASADTSSFDAILDPAGPQQMESPNLLITFQVTGGLAGLNDILTISPPGHAHLQRRAGMPIDLDLGANRFQELVALFPESDFFSMLPRHTALRAIPDALTFSVTARDDQREHTVVMSTAGSPPIPLIDMVRRLERVRQEMISPAAPLASP